jgi:hypothetical protein
MMEGAIGPCERLHNPARDRRRRSLQGDLFQHLIAAGFAFGIKLFPGILECLGDQGTGRRPGVFGGVEPLGKRQRT